MISLKKVFFLIICFFKIINSVNVINDEVQCLVDIGIKTQDTTLIKPDLKSIFCSSTFNACHDNGTVSYLYFSQKTTKNLTWSDFSCLKSLNYLNCVYINIDSSFIYNTPANIFSLSIREPLTNVKIEQMVPKLISLSVSVENNSTIKFSYLKKVGSFSSLSRTVDLEADGDQSDSLLYRLDIKSNNLPDLRTFKKLNQFTFIFSNTFNLTSYQLYSGLVNTLQSISFSSEASTLPPIDFPTKFTSQPNLKYSFLTFNYIPFNPANELIDLSSNTGVKDNPTLISISGANFFNYRGKFPFSSISGGKVGIFSMVNGNFSDVPDLSIFSNTSSLNLVGCKIRGTFPKIPISIDLTNFFISGNELTGTVDGTWCKIKSLDVSVNKLSGLIPDCFYCYLNFSNNANRFRNNNFTNYTPNSVSCGYNSISVYSAIGTNGFSLEIKGKNFGGDSNNFVSVPPIWAHSITTDTINALFSPSIDVSKYETIVVGFKNPAINFTVPLNSQKTMPSVERVTQQNNTIIIDGTYFQYDISIVNVFIGTIPCTVSYSTFNQIKCDIIVYPIMEGGRKLLELLIGPLSASFTFNLEYSKFACQVPSCNDHGVCDDHYPGICRCFSNWITIGNDICLAANQYVSSSTKVIESQGGNITLSGMFGNINNDLKVKLSDSLTELPIYAFNSDSIYTSIPSTTDPNSSSIKLIISQNGITWVGNIYPYYDETVLCFNDCNGVDKGVCNTKNGECQCNEGFFGLDCGVVDSVDDENGSEINSKGISILSNDNINYQVFFNSIYEIDINKASTSPIYDLSKSWKFIDKIGTISTFSQIVNGANIKLMIEQVLEQDKQFSFAGNEFNIKKDGIKISLSIDNWIYSSNSNTLRVVMKSNISSTNSDCDIGETTIQTSTNSNLFKNNINYLKFQTKEKVLYGRFMNSMISDSKANTILTSSSSLPNSNIFEINFDLPHCENCLIDPDFSILSTKESTCKVSSELSKTTIIVVAIVVPVVVIGAITITAIMLIKKKIINIKNIKMDSFKK